MIDLVRGPNKKEWLEDYLIRKLPYHPQWYRRNTRFDAVLSTPVEFGNAAVAAKTMRAIGLPKLESIAHVRLLSSISSADATTDTKVEGVLSQPVFAANSACRPRASRAGGAMVPSRRTIALHLRSHRPASHHRRCSVGGDVA